MPKYQAGQCKFKNKIIRCSQRKIFRIAAESFPEMYFHQPANSINAKTMEVTKIRLLLRKSPTGTKDKKKASHETW